ncbi:hypothetical protein ACFW6C_24925 [Streptomyces fungicidicus]|uniref:hypothetical protein n=1 Tax=Streptomyces fungicidicus TaxID=68203 RepID=UPI0036C11D75
MATGPGSDGPVPPSVTRTARRQGQRFSSRAGAGGRQLAVAAAARTVEAIVAEPTTRS